MIVKTFEIRDRHTLIAALAIQLSPGCEADRFLIARAGFGVDAAQQAEYILLVRLENTHCNVDPYAWGNRTMTVAHQEILRNWDALETGAILDVEYILGETKEPKKSERGA